MLILTGTQWVKAAGGTEEDGVHIYNAFRTLQQKAKAERRAAAGRAISPPASPPSTEEARPGGGRDAPRPSAPSSGDGEG